MRLILFCGPDALAAPVCAQAIGAPAYPSASRFDLTADNIRNALYHIAQKLEPQSKAEYYHISDMSIPFNAFFYLAEELPLGQSWKNRADEMKLEPRQIEQSWSQPVHLYPLPIALYKGNLFPAHYFLRSTTYINKQGAFKHVLPYNLDKYAERLPYATLHQDGSLDIHDHGSEKLFELWTQNHLDDGKVTMYRACSKTEYELQTMAKDLTEHAPSGVITPEETESLKALLNDSRQSGFRFSDFEAQALLDEFTKAQSRHEGAVSIARYLSVLQKSTLVSFSYDGAEDFKKSDGDVVIVYQMPAQKIKEMIGRQLYLGIEINYFELAFVDEGKNQESKLSLYRSIVGTR